MRKKQLYAILLAGVVSANSVPSVVLAAEADAVQTVSESTEAESEPGDTDGGETENPSTPTDTPSEPEELPTNPTQTPNDPADTPVQPTETPTDSTEDSSVPPANAETAQEATGTPEISQVSEARNPGDSVENTETGVYISFIDESGAETKKEYYETLQYAVNAALKYYQAPEHDKSKAVVVKIEKQFFLSETVKIENGKINIVATTPDVSIGRIDPNDTTKVLDGDMFVVTGSNSELQFSTENGGKFTISGDNGSAGTKTSSGSIVRVESGCNFGMSNGVILTENNTTANGAAICNNGGYVVLKGGTVTGNTSNQGAVYSTTDIDLQGTVSIKDNKTPDNLNANLYLDGEASAVVTDTLTGSAISLTAVSVTEGRAVVKAGKSKDGTDIILDADTIKQFMYDTEDYTIELSQDGKSAVLKGTVVESQPKVTDSKITGLEKPLKFFPGKAYKFNVVGAGFENKTPVKDDIRWNPVYWAEDEKPTDKQKQTFWRIRSAKGIKKAGKYDMYVFFKKQVYDGNKWTDTDIVEHVKITFQSAAISDKEWKRYVNFLNYQNHMVWFDHNTVSVTMSTTKDCKWYSYLVDAGTSNTDIKKLYKEENAKTEAKANRKFSVEVKDIPEKDVWLVVAAKPDDGGPATYKIIKLANRPKPTKPDRKPHKYHVSESTVTGLENPLKFFPKQTKPHKFNVIGAGQNVENPVTGDEKWIPLYWSMFEDGKKKMYSWQIISEKGIKGAHTYPMYIFFEKQIFNGEKWVDPGVGESMKITFRSAEISDEEWNAYIEEYNKKHPDAPLNPDGTSADPVADLTPTEAASKQDTGSANRTAAETADTAPIGSMSALAALSLLAGGYVLVRKRKKEEI